MLKSLYALYFTTFACLLFANPLLAESGSRKALSDVEIEERCTELVVGPEVRYDPIKRAIQYFLMDERQRRLIYECKADLKVTLTNMESDNNYFGQASSDNQYRSGLWPQDQRSQRKINDSASKNATKYISTSAPDAFSRPESQRPLRGYSVVGSESK